MITATFVNELDYRIGQFSLPENAICIVDTILTDDGELRSEIKDWCYQTFGKIYYLVDHVYSIFNLDSNDETYHVAMAIKILHFDSAADMLAFKLRWL